MQGLAVQALHQYMPIAEDIIAGRITGENNIGLQLDYMLDFCWDDTFLGLYEKVLHSLRDKYPELVASYLQDYREMWDSDEDGADEEDE